jgi:hypothetical protein
MQVVPLDSATDDRGLNFDFIDFTVTNLQILQLLRNYQELNL